MFSLFARPFSEGSFGLTTKKVSFKLPCWDARPPTLPKGQNAKGESSLCICIYIYIALAFPLHIKRYVSIALNDISIGQFHCINMKRDSILIETPYLPQSLRTTKFLSQKCHWNGPSKFSDQRTWDSWTSWIWLQTSRQSREFSIASCVILYLSQP